jgi:hypothetical protein
MPRNFKLLHINEMIASFGLVARKNVRAAKYEVLRLDSDRVIGLAAKLDEIQKVAQEYADRGHVRVAPVSTSRLKPVVDRAKACGLNVQVCPDGITIEGEKGIVKIYQNDEVSIAGGPTRSVLPQTLSRWLGVI